MAIAGIVGYYIASMLLAKSLKVFRGSGKGALATLLASAALCFVIAADPFGVEDYVPGAGELTDAAVRIGTVYGRSLYASTSDPAMIEKLLDLHQAIVAEKDQLKSRKQPWENAFYVDLSYWTPGDHVGRYYSLPVSGESEAARLAMALAADPDTQENNLFRNVTPSDSNDIIASRLTGGTAGVYNTETRQREDIDLTMEQANALEAAVRRDIQAGRLGRTMFLTDYEEYSRSVYDGELYLHYNLTYHRENPDERNSSGSTRDTESRSVYFSISIYCTETLNALEDMGVLDNTHRLLTQAEQEAMTQYTDLGSSGGYYGEYYGYADTAYPDPGAAF